MRDLFRLDLRTRLVSRVAETPDYETAPSFSPDGKSVVYSAGIPGDRADHIFLRALDGNPARRLTGDDANDSSPEFSPDGSLIAFTRDPTYQWGGLASNWDDGGEVFVVKPDGSGLRRITGEGLTAYSPHFSPDGKAIRFSTDDGIYGVAVDGTEPPKAIADVRELGASFSPNGQSIAFSMGKYSPNYAIYACHIDGTDLRRVIHVEGGCFQPVFKHDGKGLYFFNESWPDGPSGSPKYGLWEVDLDGRNARPLADPRLFDEPLRWKP